MNIVVDTGQETCCCEDEVGWFQLVAALHESLA